MEEKMRPYFKIDVNYDVRLIPFNPVNENDELEIRAQVLNEGVAGKVTVSFYMDAHLLGSEELYIENEAYGFAHHFVLLTGKAGEHTITIELSSEEGEIANKLVNVPLTVVKESKATLNGGFVMLGPPNDRKPCDTYRNELKSFTDDDWRRYVTEMYKINQQCIIIMVTHQYLTLESKKLVAHYPSQLYPKSDITAHDPIAAILDEAEKNGQHVFIGVGNQFGHKGTYEEMAELFNRYRNYKSFYGWYFATELRMDHTQEEKLQTWQLYNYLCEYARKLSPVYPILISPMGMPSKEFQKFFEEVYFCDILMPQDWVGQCAFHIEDSEEMHKRLFETCRRVHKHLWANCEGFNFTDTPDGKWENWGCTFKEFSWDAPRVLVPRFRGGGMIGEQGFDKQMKAARPYVEKIMTFMLAGFFLPPNFKPACGGPEAEKQYEDYLKYVKMEETIDGN